MKKLFVFLGVLMFVTHAHGKRDDAILKIENESNYDIAVAISPRLNTENQNDSTKRHFSKGFVAELKSGGAFVLKRSQLGPEWGVKEGDLSHFKIGFVSSSHENIHIVPNDVRPESNIRITGEYIEKSLLNNWKEIHLR